MTNVSISVKHLIAVLKMPNQIAQKITRAQAIAGKLTNNATFPVATWPANIVSLAQFITDVTTLAAAEAAVANKTGTTAARMAALVVVMADLRSIMSMVQLKADANVVNARTIIEGAGFIVRSSGGGHKRQNAAYNTQLPGFVRVTAEGSGHTQWEMSKDMVTITILPSTNGSITTVSGLNPGDVMYFRSKKVDTNKKTYNWSPWFMLKIGSGGRNLGGGTNMGTAGNLPNTK